MCLRQVVYAARPGTIGGPFKTPVGRAVFPGLEASQTLQPPNVCINRVEYKTLGFIPGTSSQEGYFEPVDGNTFKVGGGSAGSGTGMQGGTTWW